MKICLIYFLLHFLRRVRSSPSDDFDSVTACTHWIVSRGSSLPEYMQWVILNDIIIFYYDSNTVSKAPCPDWLNSSDGQHHWSYLQNEIDYNEDIVTKGFKSALQQFNRTGSLSPYDFYQVSGCCHLYPNETYKSSLTHYFNGKDFVSFDFERQTFVAAVPQALLYKQLRNDDARNLHGLITFYKTFYLERMKMFKLAPEVCIKKAPEVKIFFKKKMSGFIKVTCHVTGFYPRTVQVDWLGPDLQLVGEGVTDVLPNEDGTYQTRRSVIVPEEDVGEHTYSCVVQHSSVTGNITRVWDVEKRSRIAVLMSLVFICLVVIGFVLWKCCRSNDAVN